MINIWREEATKEGLELYICRFESFGIAGNEYLQNGIEAAIDFQPLGKPLGIYLKNRLTARIYNKTNTILFKNRFPKMINYKRYVRFLKKQPNPNYKQYPCIVPMWDNTSRRKRNVIMMSGSTPVLYAKWLRDVLKKFKPYSSEENLVFINAWNEWAEGNHLEPDRKWGNSYLEETKKVIQEFKS